MENVNNTNNVIVIHVGEIIHMLLKKMVIILLITVIGAAAGAGYAQAQRETLMYSTTTKLYVTGTQTSAPSSASFSLGQQVIRNYIEILESRYVINQVIENLGLNMSYKDLLRCISENSPTNTCMLEITVVFPDPEWAKVVADELVIVSSAYALEIMGSTPPVVYEEAYVPTVPCNDYGWSMIIKYGLLGGIGGGAVSVFTILAFYFLNTKFSNPYKVKDKLNVPVYAMIPSDKKGQSSDMAEKAYQYFVSTWAFEQLGKRTLVFMSATTEEEQKVEIVKIAQTWAAQGKKVLCMDTNLSHPEWGSRRELQKDKEGLEKYLSGEADINAIINSGPDGFDYIAVENAQVNPGELLNTDTYRKLICELQDRYDYVLVETAPLTYSQEAVIVAALGSNLLVLSANKSKTYQVKEVQQQLKQRKIEFTAAVLKNVTVKRKNKYFMKCFGKYLGVFEK